MGQKKARKGRYILRHFLYKHLNLILLLLVDGRDVYWRQERFLIQRLMLLILCY